MSEEIDTSREVYVWGYNSCGELGVGGVSLDLGRAEDEDEQTTPDIRSHNVGASDYSKYKIQPWDIWLEYNLNPWDADIVKRVLRTKPGERRLDYEKIIHVCQERIRQIDNTRIQVAE